MTVRRPSQYLVGLAAGLGVGVIMVAVGLGRPAPYIGGVAFAIALNTAVWWGTRREQDY